MEVKPQKIDTKRRMQRILAIRIRAILMDFFLLFEVDEPTACAGWHKL